MTHMATVTDIPHHALLCRGLSELGEVLVFQVASFPVPAITKKVVYTMYGEFG